MMLFAVRQDFALQFSDIVHNDVALIIGKLFFLTSKSN